MSIGHKAGSELVFMLLNSVAWAVLPPDNNSGTKMWLEIAMIPGTKQWLGIA